jgi:hypothetical protein
MGPFSSEALESASYGLPPVGSQAISACSFGGTVLTANAGAGRSS